MNPPQLAALIAVVALAGSLAWRVLDEVQPIHPGAPRSTAASPAVLMAQVPPIGDFVKEFHVNWDNPFVPYHERVSERDRIKERINPPKIVKPPTPPPPPPPDQVIRPVEERRLVLPPPTPKTDNVPECLGIVRHGPSQQAVVMVRLPGKTPVGLIEGDAYAGWKLTQIGAGVVTFQRPDGGEEIVPVGTPAQNVVAPQAQAPSGGGTQPPVQQPAVQPPPVQRGQRFTGAQGQDPGGAPNPNQGQNPQRQRPPADGGGAVVPTPVPDAAQPTEPRRSRLPQPVTAPMPAPAGEPVLRP